MGVGGVDMVVIFFELMLLLRDGGVEMWGVFCVCFSFISDMIVGDMVIVDGGVGGMGDKIFFVVCWVFFGIIRGVNDW